MNEGMIGVLLSIDGSGKKDPNRELREGLASFIESQSLIAQILRAKYLSLIEQGFTPAQALELCK